MLLRCGGYAMLKTKYILKAVMKASSRLAHWHTSTPSTLTTLSPLAVIAILQSLSVSCMVGWSVAGSSYIEEKHVREAVTC